MKRLIALAVAAMMVLSLVPVMTITSSAADIEGDWITMRKPGEYELGEDEAYTPAPGYEYTSEGFVTIPASYKNMNPYFNIQTREAQNIKEGIYLEFRVDDYSYGGENGDDHWISVNIADTPNINPGGTDHNNNWVSLIRGNGDGNASLQSFVTVKDTEEAGGQFIHTGDVTATIPTDADGKEIYTFELTWDGSAYDIKICGVSLAGMASVTSYLNQFNADGDFYVGISFHSGVKDGVAACTILKYGNTASNATTPVGSDSEMPEENTLVYGDPIDPATIAEGQPALLWDATGSSYTGEPGGTNIAFTPQGDNSFKATAAQGVSYFQWPIRNSLTHDAESFPVFTMLLKDYWGADGGLYYCSGDVLSPNDNYVTGWSPYGDGCNFYGDDEEYTLIVVDLNQLNTEDQKMWTGRINCLRPSFTVDMADNEWTICWMGMFRTVDDANNYAMNYLGISAEDTKGEETAPAPEETTAATGEDNTATPDDVTTPVTGEGTVGEEATAGGSEDEGCASVVGMGAVAILAAAAAVVACKRKD